MDIRKNWWLFAILLIAVIGTATLVKNARSSIDLSQVQVFPLFQSAQQIAGEDPKKGTGQVTIVEFSDYECPFCGRFFREVEILLEAEYGDKLTFVFKDYPLDKSCNEKLPRQIHSFACQASIAAECADEQGKFWPYHDILFQNQNQLSDEKLKEYANVLSLDSVKFNDCLDNKKTLDEVKGDIAQGDSLGVTGTPAIIIGKQLIVGYYPYEVYKNFVEKALQG